MAEGTALLRPHTGNCIEGSNPSLSATFLQATEIKNKFRVENRFCRLFVNQRGETLRICAQRDYVVDDFRPKIEDLGRIVQMIG